METQAEELRHKIEAAFADVPSEFVLCKTDRHDIEDRADVGEFFGYGTLKWQDLSQSPLMNDIYSLDLAYNYLTPEAFRYYLPAFLINLLEFQRVSTAGSWIIETLSPPDPNSASHQDLEFFEGMLSCIDTDESQAIKSLLEYVILEKIIPRWDWNDTFAEERFTTATRALTYWTARASL